MKTSFTEEEINELCDLYNNFGEIHLGYRLLKYIQEKHNLSDVNSIIIDMRKFLIERNNKNQLKLTEKYKNSTLSNKLIKRLIEYETN